LIPPLINLSKLTAQHCQIRNLKYIDSKFPNLNIGNFKNNSIGLYEEIESIKGIDYLAEFDIRNNPLAFRPAVQEMIVADVPDLEVYNEIELLEPGFKYKVENEELKRRLAETNKEEEELLEKILDKVFDEQGEPQEKRMTQKAIQEKFEEVENNCHKNEVKLVKAQLSISANLVPLTRDKNKISEVEEFTGEQLIKESVDFKKRVKSDYETIRKDFRKVVNQLRFDELEFSQKMNSSKPDVDLYIEMLNEIKKFDQQSKINRAKFGFMTSRSDEKDSDDELEKAVPLYKENASSIIYDSTMHDEFEQIENKKKRNNSLIRKSNNKSKPLPFRSSAGFNKANKQDLTGQKIQKKTVRAGSARKKLPPTPGNKEPQNPKTPKPHFNLVLLHNFRDLIKVLFCKWRARVRGQRMTQGTWPLNPICIVKNLIFRVMSYQNTPKEKNKKLLTQNKSLPMLPKLQNLPVKDDRFDHYAQALIHPNIGQTSKHDYESPNNGEYMRNNNLQNGNDGPFEYAHNESEMPHHEMNQNLESNYNTANYNSKQNMPMFDSLYGSVQVRIKTI
jgi:hypothetical protein